MSTDRMNPEEIHVSQICDALELLGFNTERIFGFEITITGESQTVTVKRYDATRPHETFVDTIPISYAPEPAGGRAMTATSGQGGQIGAQVHDERRLLREAITWARANGWRPRDRWPGDDKVTWCWGSDAEPGVPGMYIGVHLPETETDDDYWLFTEALDALRVVSVQQAVDALVALKRLPGQFSTAYAAGVEAGRREVLDGAEVEWSARRDDGRIITSFSFGISAEHVRDALNFAGITSAHPVRRHVTAWEPVDGGDS